MIAKDPTAAWHAVYRCVRKGSVLIDFVGYEKYEKSVQSLSDIGF
jgi:hypothetical protein